MSFSLPFMISFWLILGVLLFILVIGLLVTKAPFHLAIHNAITLHSIFNEATFWVALIAVGFTIYLKNWAMLCSAVISFFVAKIVSTLCSLLVAGIFYICSLLFHLDLDKNPSRSVFVIGRLGAILGISLTSSIVYALVFRDSFCPWCIVPSLLFTYSISFGRYLGLAHSEVQSDFHSGLSAVKLSTTSSLAYLISLLVFSFVIVHCSNLHLFLILFGLICICEFTISPFLIAFSPQDETLFKLFRMIHPKDI